MFSSIHRLFMAGAVLVASNAEAAGAPYALPWQLRPAAAATAVRLDSSLALYEPASGGSTSTTVLTLLASQRFFEHSALVARVAAVGADLPENGLEYAIANAVLGATSEWRYADFRLVGFLGVAVPIGQGGGAHADQKTRLALSKGVFARAAMDNALFAVNDLTVFPGVDVAYVAHGLTVQLEATLLQLTRVRGEKSQPDGTRTNLTGGLFVGYFVHPTVSLGGELRHQRWLSTPKAPDVAQQPALRDTTTVALGVRGNFEISAGTWLRPGVSYGRGVDAPLTDETYQLIQLDLPVVF